MFIIVLLAVMGFGLSLYLFSIEQKLKVDPRYHPICDINDRVSCTKPMQSRYGKIFGFSNSVLGLFFYPLFALLALMHQTGLLFIASIGLVLFTGFLAYLLFVKIKAMCPVCLLIYMVNAGIFVASLLAYLHMR